MSDAGTLARLQSLWNTRQASAVRFKGMVDGQMTGANHYGFEPWFAALMSRVTGQASYCTYAVAQTEIFVQSEEALIRANQRAVVANDSYLEVGDYIGNLAKVYDWCRAQMTQSQRTRWVTYGNQAVWNVWNHEQARWGSTLYPWSGWSVDNPSNNYYYSFLRATMLLGLATYGENSQATTWIDKFRTAKIANELVPTFNRDLVGGGSREGTGYGVAMKGLFDIYHLWEKSTTERIADLTPHTRDSLDKFLHDIVPTLDRVVPTGDHARDSTAALFDYHREYLLVLARLYPSDPMSGIAKTLLAQSTVPVMGYAFEYWVDFVYDLVDIPAQPLSRLPTARWSSGTGQLSVRSAWATSATHVNFICGPYSESHAHRDQGSFVLFKGNWLAFDANINSHSGLVQDEAAHNLVRVEKNGTVQTQRWDASCNLLALADNAVYSYAVADVTPMYAGSATVTKVQREVLLLKPATLVVLDRVDTSGSGVRRVWTLNLPTTPTVSGDRLTAWNGSSQLDVRRLAPTGLTSQVLSWPAIDPDVEAGSRVDVAHTTGNGSVFLNVIGADQAYGNAVRSDQTGQTGAVITLANGDVATLRFNNASTGGTIDVRTSGNVVKTSGNLPTSIQVLQRLAN
ncbi:MAG: hypothetical protein ACKVQR_16100 [Aquabacterium sp.]